MSLRLNLTRFMLGGSATPNRSKRTRTRGNRYYRRRAQFIPHVQLLEERIALAAVTVQATDANASEVGPDPGVFTITRSLAESTPLTVNFTLNGTATPSTDYASVGTSVTIPAYATSAQVTITPTADSVVESSETVVLAIASSGGYTIGSPSTAQVAIANAPLPTVTVAASDAGASEVGPDAGAFTISRTGATTQSLVVNFSLAGTASAGTDYSSISTTVTIPVGAASTTIIVNPIADSVVESTEAVVLNLFSSSQYNIGSPASAQVAIADAPAPTITISASDPSASETGPDQGTFTISRTGGVSQSLVVNYALSGSATSGTDYTSIGSSVTIPVGASSAVVTVTPLSDAISDPNETVVMYISGSSQYTVGSPSSATITIGDATVPTITIALTDSDASEVNSNPGVFSVSRTGSTTQSLVVALSVGGTASNGTDYTTVSSSVTIPAGQSSATVTITPNSDAVVEGAETVVLAVASGAGYAVGTPSSQTLSIADTPILPTVSIATTYGQAAELNAAAGNFTISRTGNTSQALTVNVAVAGSATAGTDYTSLATSITIPAGSSSANVSVAPIRDNIVEGQETVVVTLSTSTSYTIGTPNSGTVTIADDPPIATIQAWDATATEVGANSGAFRVSRTGGNINSPLTVNFAVAGSATPATDYAVLGARITIPSGALYATLDVSPVSDGLAEATETVVVTLTSGTSYVLGASTSSTVTIDDGPSTVTVTSLVPTANESDGSSAKFRFSRAGGDQSQSVTLYFSVSGTATPADDYPALGTSVTIAAGASIADIELLPLEDGEVEDTESVIITLASNAAYQLGTPSSATVMIEDDLPTVMIIAGDDTATELNETPASFTVQLSSVTPEDITVNYVVGGSATPVTDYLALSGTVTIPAGQSNTTITISPLSDAIFESSETVLVTLASGSGYEMSDAVSATVSITDQAGPITLEAGSDASAVEGAAFQRALGFTDPWGQSWSVSIDYGDGSNPSLLNLNSLGVVDLDHVFADNGQFSLTVTVTAQDGRTASDTFLVTVANVAPALDLGDNRRIGSDGAFTYSGSFVDPGSDTWTATVNYGFGIESLPLEGREFTLEHAYPAPGVYPVTVAVSDDDQATGTSTFFVTVNSRPQLDLNVADSSTTDFVTAFVEGGSPAIVTNVDATVTDVDDAQLSSIAVQLVNREDVAETLSADASGTSIQVAYSDSTLWLTGQDTLAHYQQVLRTVSYAYMGNRPPLTSRLVSIVASDGLDDSDPVTATIAIESVNDPPHAFNDDLVLGQDVISQILLGSDGDDEITQPLTLTIVTPPAHGRLSAFDATSGLAWYSPDPGYIGTDSVSYSLAENVVGGLASGVVTRAITLVRTNNAPVANAAVLATTEDHVATVTLSGDDGESDLEQALTFLVTTPPAHGILTNWNPTTGTAEYTPDPGYSGSDSFVYTVTDDSSLNWPATTSEPATVSIAIAPVNDVPNMYVVPIGVGKNIATVISLGDDGDEDYDQLLSLVIVTPPSHGVLSGFDAASGTVLYTPQTGYLGPDGFSFRLSDDAAAGSPQSLVSATAAVAIEVVAAPIAMAGQQTTTEDSPVTFALVADDGDVAQNRILTVCFRQACKISLRAVVEAAMRVRGAA
ncbi:MAG: beta strand repeat-containing protein, partial [Pirellulaceae bacterium]